MVAGQQERDLSGGRGSPAASMGREDPAPGAEKGSCGAGPDGREEKMRTMDRRGGPVQELRDSGRGRWGHPGTRPLDGSGLERARLSAADGSLGAALQPGAHVRAWLSPYSLSAPAGSVPSPQFPRQLPAPPSCPEGRYS